jgi:hypothetical protein
VRWPLVKRRALEDERVASSLLRAKIRGMEAAKAELEHELRLANLRAAEAMDHGYRMGAGLPYQGGSPDNASAEYLRQHGEPLGGG